MIKIFTTILVLCLFSCHKEKNITIFYLQKEIRTPSAILCDELDKMHSVRKIVLSSKEDVEFIKSNILILDKYKKSFDGYDIRHKIYIDDDVYCFNNYRLYNNDVEFSKRFENFINDHIDQTEILNPLPTPRVE